MVRRRLAPAPLVPAAASADVPRAEHLTGTGPIARVAADAAGSAAARELAAALEQARETGRMVLDLDLDAIAADHLTRDRLCVEDPEMAALRTSIRAHGQRTPIEVTPVAGPGGGLGADTPPWGLISGWRRLAAVRGLHEETGEARFATIQALVRRPGTAAAAYVAMVEENEIRVGLSQYERARVAAMAAARGVFDSEDAALRALFATASRPKRSRIRSFLEIYHALEGSLRFPAHLPERLGLRLVERLRAGQGARIAAALAEADAQSPEAELALLERLARPAAKAPSSRPDREQILPGVVLEQRLEGRVPSLSLRGKGVTPDLVAALRAGLARLPRS